MGIIYRVQETCRNGSFKLWGIGFIYNYNAYTEVMDILHSRGKTVLHSVQLDSSRIKYPQVLAKYIEKSSQIKALVLSNNTTINLVSTLESERLPLILESVAEMALLSYDISQNRLAAFTRDLCLLQGIESAFVKKMSCQRSNTQYYKARVCTENGHETMARAPSLAGVLRALSEHIIQDILPHEFSTRNKTTENLLTLSSKLALISRIIDQKYKPYVMEIKQPMQANNSLSDKNFT